MRGRLFKEAETIFIIDERSPPHHGIGYGARHDPALAWGYALRSVEASIQTDEPLWLHLLKTMTQEKHLAICTNTTDMSMERVFGDEVPILETHGSIEFMQCNTNCSNELWTPHSVDMDMTVDGETGRAERTPKCRNPECTSGARFNILLQGDTHFCDRKRRIQRDMWRIFIDNQAGKDAILVVELCKKTNEKTLELVRHLGANYIQIKEEDCELTQIHQEWLQIK